MADTVKIGPKPTAPPGKQYMQVDHDLINVKAGDLIAFYNELKPTVSDVTIKFYSYNSPKSDANAIAGFCESMGSDKEFTVSKGSNAGGTFTPGHKDCKVASGITSGYYKYSVHPQAAAWIEMDPVIIIEGGGGMTPLLPGFFAALFGAALGGVLTMRYFATRRDKQA
ncbi:MAG: hypothetical protein R3176_02365 [Woeseiaceae bacterium]|nr:hypothetical protein [Woeseiaceae bacterium]